MNSRYALLSVLLFLQFFFKSEFSEADISRLRFTTLGGLAQSMAKGLNNSQDIQQPIGLSAHVEYPFNGQWEVGAEHYRTVSERSGSAIGLTGLSIKNYFWFSHPQVYQPEEEARTQAILKVKAFIPYIGFGMGIAQASIIDKNVSAVALYAAGKGGMEFAISDRWGWRVEGTLGYTLYGSGQLQYISVLGGFYLFL